MQVKAFQRVYFGNHRRNVVIIVMTWTNVRITALCEGRPKLVPINGQ